jgi:hypothetical protein
LMQSNTFFFFDWFGERKGGHVTQLYPDQSSFASTNLHDDFRPALCIWLVLCSSLARTEYYIKLTSSFTPSQQKFPLPRS